MAPGIASVVEVGLIRFNLPSNTPPGAANDELLLRLTDFQPLYQG